MRIGLALGVAGLPLAAAGPLAARAERAGADTLCVGEAWDDSFAAATVVALASRRARVMTAVTTWSRPPVATAVGAVTVDEVAAGRFALGLGTMPAAWSRDRYGIDPSRPLGRMREYVEVVRGAVAATPAEPLHHDGEWFPVRHYPGTPRARGPVPVHLAATRPGMARLAGEIADGVLVNVVHTPRWLTDVLLPALQEGEACAGRRVERGVMVRTALHDGSPAGRIRALQDARRSLELYRGVPYLAEVAASEGVDLHATPEPPDEIVRALAVVGTVEEVRDALLERYHGLVDWVELTPCSGLGAARLAEAYDGLLDLTACLATPSGTTPAGDR